MSLPPHHPLLQQNPEWLVFLVPAYPGCPGKRPLNGCSVVVDVRRNNRTEETLDGSAYREVGRIEAMLFVLVGAVDVGLAQPQHLVGSSSRRLGCRPHGVVRLWHVEPRCGHRRRLARQPAVRLRPRQGGQLSPAERVGAGHVQLVAGVDSPGPTQQLVVNLQCDTIRSILLLKPQASVKTDLTGLWIGFCLTGPISLCLDSFLCMYVFSV